jgi:hypothetical protein
MSPWKQTGSPRPICSSVMGVDEIWAPVESTEDCSSEVMPLQCESRISGPSRPYFVRGPTASKADYTFLYQPRKSLDDFPFAKGNF